jgi:hypothetical protein
MEFLDHSIHKIAFKALSMKKIYWFYSISGFFRRKGLAPFVRYFKGVISTTTLRRKTMNI